MVIEARGRKGEYGIDGQNRYFIKFDKFHQRYKRDKKRLGKDRL